MKILHINSYYNGSIFYKNLYDQQEKNGLDISVFVPVAHPFESSDDFGRYTRVSANHSKRDRLFFHLKHNKIYKDITKKYDIEKYSIIHAHSLFSNGYIAMKLKQNFGVPYIVAVRNTDVNVFFNRMLHLRKMGINILTEAEKIIFLSKPYRDLVIEKYVPNNLKQEIYKKVSVIPNGIDDFWFQESGIKKTVVDKNDLKLLYVGTIDKNKNIETTLKAIEILQQKDYKIAFTVVGKIKDENIYNLIKNIPYVHYITPKPKEKLIEIYRSNDIFVMPSITETFGLVYAEAMSQGLPVIYSRGQGFDQQFSEGLVGYPVNCYDAEEIAEKIEKIIYHYESIRNACLEKYTEFNWENITKKYLRLYDETIHKNS
ncbi:glycosyltransferase family 4 protein [Clostridia bacterium]|nr:glycosyltransferase family 4 protein [Clostridia bacterium]